MDVNKNISNLVEVSRTVVLALEHHLVAPREVNVMLASQSLREWDTTFLAQVARDGIVLYSNESWPSPLQEIRSASERDDAVPRAS